MSQTLIRQRHWAQKSIAHLDTARLDCLMKNTQELVKQGLPTPLLRYSDDKHVIKMFWLDGEDEQALIKSIYQDLQALYFSTQKLSVVEKLIDTVIFLHACNLEKLTLNQFDSWRRIDPRIEFLKDAASQMEYDNVVGLARLIKSIGRDLILTDIETVVVHGDLHVGQWIYEKQTNNTFLIDLEDLALGDRESDIANFAAHFATTYKTDHNHIHDLYYGLSRYATDIYQHKSAIQLDENKLDFYGACALLRRALKLHEQHRQPNWLDVLDVCKSLTRSLLSRVIQR